MNITTIIALLQLTMSLLSGAHNNSAMSVTTTEQIVALGNRTVQLATQAAAPINFAIPANDSIWPNVTDLLVAPYRTANGSYVQQGSATVQLNQSTISFGDLNNDGLDDAAAIVTRPAASGVAESDIAMFINQNNIMFNVADLSLGTASVTVYSHHIVGGLLVMDMQPAGGVRATTTYQLLGNQIVK